MSGNEDRMKEFSIHADERYLRQKYIERVEKIRSTEGFNVMSRMENCLTVQMYDPQEWRDLFGRESLSPELQQYVDDIFRFNQDTTGTVSFKGHLEVSLLLEENVNPVHRGIHRAVFLIYVTPHKQFYDGHIIGIEFGEGSRTHQTINRIFDVKTRALIQVITQYDILTFLADENEMNTLLYEYFLQDFNPKYYGINPDHKWHKCCHPDHKEKFQFTTHITSLYN
jgi:hypothetical protein